MFCETVFKRTRWATNALVLMSIDENIDRFLPR
jgi:hypothetical protein